MNILHICPPHLSDVAAVPWEIQKSRFSKVLFIHTSDYVIPIQPLAAIGNKTILSLSHLRRKTNTGLGLKWATDS